MLIKCKKTLKIESVGWLPLLNRAACSPLSLLLLIPALRGSTAELRCEGMDLSPLSPFLLCPSRVCAAPVITSSLWLTPG